MSNPFFFPWADPEYQEEAHKKQSNPKTTVFINPTGYNVSMEIGRLTPPIIGVPENDPPEE